MGEGGSMMSFVERGDRDVSFFGGKGSIRFCFCFFLLKGRWSVMSGLKGWREAYVSYGLRGA